MRRSTRAALCAALALGPAAAPIAGCAGPGLTRRYEEARRQLAERAAREPAREPAPADEASAAADDVFSGTGALDAAALVREVLRRNPTLEAAREAWRAALARYPQDVAPEDPTLDVGVGPRSFGSAGSSDAFAVELRQPIAYPGTLRLRGARALADADASRGELDAARLELALRAHVLLADYSLTARAIEINDAHLRLLDELRDSALARYEAGLVSQQDPLEAETERLELVHRAIELGARSRTRAAQLNALLHRSAGLPLPPPATIAPEAPAPADETADETTRRALASRPELAAADARIAARESARALALRAFLPDLEAWGKYDAFWSESELRPSVGVAARIPLQVGRRRAQLEEADAELARARAERRRLEDEIRAEAVGAAERLLEQRHLTELLARQTLPAVRDRVAAARAAYDAGQADFATVIDAFRAQLRAELAYQTALATEARRRAELAGAAGDAEALGAGKE